MKKISLITVELIGALICIYTLILCFLTNFNIGNLLSLSFGCMFLFAGFAVPKLGKGRLSFIIKSGVLCYFVFFAFMILFIFISSQTTKTDFTEDAVVVLGCAVHGETPSPTLYKRLEQSVVYSQKNPDALIIVSGGQGPQEEISEARAMANYLYENGVDEKRIILEDKSTSTSENFKFSKEILYNAFPDGYTLCYITNDFHSYRAGRIAKLNGIEAKSFNCKTDISSVLPLYLRECLAVIKLWIFKY